MSPTSYHCSTPRQNKSNSILIRALQPIKLLQVKKNIEYKYDFLRTILRKYLIEFTSKPPKEFSDLFPENSIESIRQLLGDFIFGVFSSFDRTILSMKDNQVTILIKKNFDYWIEKDIDPSNIDKAFWKCVKTFKNLLSKEEKEAFDIHLKKEKLEIIFNETLKRYHSVFREHFERQVAELSLLKNISEMTNSPEDLAEIFLEKLYEALDADYAIMFYSNKNKEIKLEKNPDHFLRFSKKTAETLISQSNTHDPELLDALLNIFKKKKNRNSLSPFNWEDVAKVSKTNFPEGLFQFPKEPKAVVEDIRPKSMIITHLFERSSRVGFLALMKSSSSSFNNRDNTFFEVAAKDFSRILENKNLQEELRLLAQTDGLTNLLNRRRFFELGNIELERSKRYEGTFSIMMLDVDNFKEINDTYGHQIGDEVLKNLAEYIQKRSRAGDLSGRYGGEEFMLLLLESDSKNTEKAAEKLLKEIQNISIPVNDDEKINFTVSIGVATYPESGNTLNEIISVADECLYVAKSEGKNCVRVKK